MWATVHDCVLAGCANSVEATMSGKLFYLEFVYGVHYISPFHESATTRAKSKILTTNYQCWCLFGFSRLCMHHVIKEVVDRE